MEKGYGFQVLGFRFQVTSFRFQALSKEYFGKVIKIPVTKDKGSAPGT